MKLVIRFLVMTVALLLAACATTKIEGSIEDNIDIIFANHKDQPGYAELRQQFIDDYKKYLEWDPLGHKAYAIAWDVGGKYVGAGGYGSLSVASGSRFAMTRCKDKRKAASIEARCTIFAKGNNIVLDTY